jgi:hypothetical protein
MSRQRQQRTNYIRQKQQPGAEVLTAPLLWAVQNIVGTKVTIQVYSGQVNLVSKGVPQIKNDTKGMLPTACVPVGPPPSPEVLLFELTFPAASEPGDVFIMESPSRAIQTYLGAVLGAQITTFPLTFVSSLDITFSVASWDPSMLNLTAAMPFTPLLATTGAQVINQTTGESGRVQLPDNNNVSVEFPVSSLSAGDTIFIPGGQLQFSGPYGGRNSEATFIL